MSLNSIEQVAVFPKFTSLRLLNRQVWNALLPQGEEASDFQWLSLNFWNSEAKVSALAGACVIEFNDYHNPDSRFFSFCGGSDPNKVAAELLKHARSAGLSRTLRLIPESVVHKLNPSEFLIQEDRDNHDYVYSMPSTFLAAGSNYRKIRAVVKRMEINYGERMKFRKLSLSNKTTFQMRNLVSTWVNEKQSSPSAVDEMRAFGKFFELTETEMNQETFLIFGLFLDGELIAFSIDEQIGPQLALGHFGHASRVIANASTYLHWRVAEQVSQKGIIWLNDEQDLGDLGLRRHKLIKNPERFVRKFEVMSLDDI